MADPDSRAKPAAHGPQRQQQQQRSVDFIRRELIPEMVHDRCFCEPGSREFVEFDSADVVPLDAPVDRSRAGTYSCELYRVTAHVKFSGETCSFPLIVKLLKNSADCPVPSGPFQNEEMFYSKMTLKYGTDGVPKCYLSDLGRYGRPVIALDDLGARGYVRADRKLDEDHLKLCVKALATFHGRGLSLRADKFAVFREFYAKFSDARSDDDYLKRDRRNDAVRALDVLKLLPEPALAGKIRGKLSESPSDVMESLAAEINDVSTVCHGRFSRDNVLFRYESGKPCDVKVIDWQTMRYCSPAIDLGPVLLANLPDGEPAKVGTFCRDILRLYLDGVRRQYSQVACDLLERDIIAKLLYAYIVLSTGEAVADGELLAMLHVLDNLGTFD